jgi:hypothetical protein
MAYKLDQYFRTSVQYVQMFLTPHHNLCLGVLSLTGDFLNCKCRKQLSDNFFKSQAAIRKPEQPS